MAATSVYTLLLSLIFVGKQIITYRFKRAKAISNNGL